jgi:FkbM family methyltransferase
VDIVALIDRTPAMLAGRLRVGARGSRFLARILNPLVPPGETVVTVRSGPASGMRIAIDPRREKYYWTGAFEPAVQRTLTRLLQPGMCFWDIGAHAGFMTILAARLTGDGGRVLAFEPAPPNRERLRTSVAANGLKTVEVHDVAVGATAGTSIMHHHGSTSMWTTIAQLGDVPGAEVRCRTLDDLASEYAVPDLIKVDVEGAEADVLRGGCSLLGPGGPALLVEFNPRTLEEARAVLPVHDFEQLDANHWLLKRGSQ